MDDAEVRAEEWERQILRERAQVLSRPVDTTQASSGSELLVFTTGGERFGIDLTSAREALPLPEVVPVPHTPDWVAGVMSYRGRVLSVVDLRRFLALPEGGGEIASRHLLVLEPPGMTFGLLVDEVHGVVHPEGALAPVPAGAVAGERPSFVRGIAAGGIAVLDLLALSQHPGFRVGA